MIATRPAQTLGSLDVDEPDFSSFDLVHETEDMAVWLNAEGELAAVRDSKGVVYTVDKRMVRVATGEVFKVTSSGGATLAMKSVQRLRFKTPGARPPRPKQEQATRAEQAALRRLSQPDMVRFKAQVSSRGYRGVFLLFDFIELCGTTPEAERLWVRNVIELSERLEKDDVPGRDDVPGLAISPDCYGFLHALGKRDTRLTLKDLSQYFTSSQTPSDRQLSSRQLSWQKLSSKQFSFEVQVCASRPSTVSGFPSDCFHDTWLEHLAVTSPDTLGGCSFTQPPPPRTDTPPAVPEARRSVRPPRRMIRMSWSSWSMCAPSGTTNSQTTSQGTIPECEMRVLVADDNTADCINLIRRIAEVSTNGIAQQIVDACDGSALLQVSKIEHVVIFLSLHMFPTTAAALAQSIRIREKLTGAPRVKLVAVGHNPTPDQRRAALNSGIDEVMGNPVPLWRLRLLLQQAGWATTRNGEVGGSGRRSGTPPASLSQVTPCPTSGHSRDSSSTNLTTSDHESWRPVAESVPPSVPYSPRGKHFPRRKEPRLPLAHPPGSPMAAEPHAPSSSPPERRFARGHGRNEGGHPEDWRPGGDGRGHGKPLFGLC
eukprot:Hpha_TRINITY_DN16686_c3_g1::TRINITY_DN16686_c3_g1_i2::g.180070::m.180070